MKDRASGILLHISSLSSNYGIGTFGQAAFDFVDFLVKSNQTYWQILPIGPTSFGDSPYQSFSIDTINPYFIDLDLLLSEGLLNKEDIIDSKEGNYVNYPRLYNERFVVLKRAFNNFNLKDEKYNNFLEEHTTWVYDYANFMAIKKHFENKSLIDWPEQVRKREKEVLEPLFLKL